MTNSLKTYLTAVRQKHATGVAREHAYRPPLEQLLYQLNAGLTVINDPVRIACGAPDFILLKQGIPLGYIEAKDVGVLLEEAAATDQLKRYRKSLHNLILTNYLSFQWYVAGELQAEASLGRLRGGEIVPAADADIEAVADLLARFFNQEVTPLASAEALAKRMAHLAKLMDRAITATFEQEPDSGPFHAQLRAFREALIPSLSPAEFADMYAQTLTYGLFAARVQQSDGGGEFNRDTIHRYLPSTNPFLSDFFYQISGRNMPDAVSWLVDDLAHLLRRADMAEILAQFGRRTRYEDPIIHFYETFLREYDPRLRQSRGVYYTPEPVVSYIVRSLDQILQSHFGRPLGLADPNTLILDPATGTGTFFYFVIQHIHERLRQMGQAGGWNSYVKTSLLPRLFGFELLMAPYAVAHLKLGLLLRELGYRFDSQERLNIFLTNALSEPVVSRDTLGFAGFLSQEGAHAADVKRNKPIEVIIGNPPYSGHSSNTGDWIVDKVRDYYFVDGQPLGERNPKWLQDDYVKFIRWAQWRIEQTGRGVVGFVTNHGFLDNPTFRGMRQQLLRAFDEIYILDLHGNSKKKEQSPDGSKDENVFDIQQGVAITIFVKTSSSQESAKVYRADLWGTRPAKYSHLFEQTRNTAVLELIKPQRPLYVFLAQDVQIRDEYSNHISVTAAFPTNVLGFQTHRDSFAIAFEQATMEERITDLIQDQLTSNEVIQKYDLAENPHWNVAAVRAQLRTKESWRGNLQKCLYRPFDWRWSFYDSIIIDRPRTEILDHLVGQSNLCLNLVRQTKSQEWRHAIISDVPTPALFVEIKDGSSVFPLYLYTKPESTAGTLFATTQTTREPNLSRDFIRTAEQTLGLTFTVPADFTIQPPTPAGAATFTPEDIFYYAYAIFHSPTYRQRYAEFLKIDFPRLPLTGRVPLFRRLAHLGHQLTQLHLMTSPALDSLSTSFPISGSNQVAAGHPRYVEPRQELFGPVAGRVYINPEQYIEGVEPAVWEFQIGGYQPLEKWLKDRRGRTLTFADLLHYQRIIVALRQTIHLMTQIDQAIPGWPLDGDDNEGGEGGGNDQPQPSPSPPSELAIDHSQLTVDHSPPPPDQTPISNPPISPSSNPLIPASPSSPELDTYLIDLNLFPIRVQNALMRAGLVTLRLLVMCTPEWLLISVRNLGEKGLAEIESKLAQLGLSLATAPSKQPIHLFAQIATMFYKNPGPRRLSALAHAARLHPYLIEVETDVFRFELRPPPPPDEPAEPEAAEPETADIETDDEPPIEVVGNPLDLEYVGEDGRLQLHKLWPAWFAGLADSQQAVLIHRFGLTGEELLTLQEVAVQLGLTRERVRQIEVKALGRLRTFYNHYYYDLFCQQLGQAIEETSGLLLPANWDRFCDAHFTWEGQEVRPPLLPLLGELSADFHYLDSDNFNVATYAHINTSHLRSLNIIASRLLRPVKKDGLSLEELVAAVQAELPAQAPDALGQPAFIERSIELFERIGLGPDGRYRYLPRAKKSRFASADSGWAGKPGTQLHEWELRLRQEFERIAWIGQLALSEQEFHTLCKAIREEAQEPNYFTKVNESQPRLVPPAVFMTTMVFTARYAEQAPDESIDEFWAPYSRTVWGVAYSQAWHVRCRKRFLTVVPYLEQTFGFEFPRQSEGNIVTPIYRHALIPRYMQADFAQWLRKGWQNILSVAQTPALLAAQLQQDRSLDYYSHRLKQFVRGKATAETAAALISNMAAAISLHLRDGESIESISHLLAGTPIEQELWREIAQEFQSSSGRSAASLRLSQPRLTWIWSLDDRELALRVQNIILPAGNGLQGEPDRLLWLPTANSDPADSISELQLSPWRMQTGERVINDVLFNEPDGPLAGELVLLTDADEIAARFSIPAYPNDPVQFFRLTQQGAYAIPVRREQISDGPWLICAAQPLTLLDEDGELIEADTTLSVPYPLDKNYRWAAQFSLNLPITVQAGAQKLFTLADVGDAPAIGRPALSGQHPIAGLSRQVPPTFASTNLTITIEYGGERLLKQASLWIQGRDGWRYQRPLADLRQQEVASLAGNGLSIELGRLLPQWANNYTLELRFSLQPVFPAPLEFAIVPGLELVDAPAVGQLFTPANLPQLILRGLPEAAVARQPGMEVVLQAGGSQQITWTDLRYEPRLTLRLDKVDIPLAWPVNRFMAWLEPRPSRPFLTLDELRQTTLHAIASAGGVQSFRLFVPGERYREFPLRRGRLQLAIGQSQLYDMVRRPGQSHTIVKAQVETDTWPLFELRARPQLPQVNLEYDPLEKMLLLHTGLAQPWPGQLRFIAESLSNPFAPHLELHQTNRLEDSHLIPADLPNGVYLLRLELDGAGLALPETQLHFTVGPVETEPAQSQSLVEAIRSGQFINPRQAEDFVLWWAELAEIGQASLTPATLFQLATISASAANLKDNFQAKHLERLWPPLAALRAVQNQSQWLETYGYLPAWLILATPLTLKLSKGGAALQVIPLQVAQGGREGKGYAHWRLSPVEGTSKERVFVQWRPLSAVQVQIEAGLPDGDPGNDWSHLELIDTHSLYHCPRCGWLVGARAQSLPAEIRQTHRHGRDTDDLQEINYGDYQLLAELIPERRSKSLLEIYAEDGVLAPPATYLAEPAPAAADFLQPDGRRLPLLALIRELKRHGLDGELPLWASAARLLMTWQQQKDVTPLGQAAFALAVLLRTAAYKPHAFKTIRKDASLSEADCQQLLADFNKLLPDHLQWGLTWAELLYCHNPRS